jgi:hypothetical protein
MFVMDKDKSWCIVIKFCFGTRSKEQQPKEDNVVIERERERERERECAG